MTQLVAEVSLEPEATSRQSSGMQGFFTRLLVGCLALTLVLTAETMAMARGASAPVGEIILCTSHGVMAVPVDAEGQPTEPAHICPDCALFFAAYPAQSIAFARSTDLVSSAFVPARACCLRQAERPVPSARAPPLSL